MHAQKILSADSHVIRVKNLMWGSDFPHSDSTWPNSLEVIARDFEGVPDDERRLMTPDNVAALYGFD